jgi:hypothetical protein
VRPVRFAAVILCIAFAVLPLGAEDDDIDSLFDEQPDTEEEIVQPKDPDSGKKTAPPEASAKPPAAKPAPVATTLNSRGFTFDVNYSFIAGYSPGWAETPWNWKDHKDEEYDSSGKARTGDPFTQLFAAEMKSAFTLDFRVSPALRVHQLFRIDYPKYALVLKEFFADYNMSDTVFFRIGRHTVNWGNSRNFPFTNLPVLLPLLDVKGKPLTTTEDDYSYAIKVDVPIGIGGLQFLALTRKAFMEVETNPQLEEFGYGIKYNLAFNWADIDLGSYYHRSMPARSLLSVKSTLPNGTEIYSEGLVALSQTGEDIGRNRPQYWNNQEFSFSVGVYDDFFSRKLSLNLEYFFNGERDARWLQPENSFQVERVSPLIYGHNGAVNISFRPGGLGNLRLFARCLYGFEEETAQLVPGISFTPVLNLNVYLGFPMALGSRYGTYYTQNADRNNRPFSMVLAVSIGGNYRFSYSEPK